VRSPAGIPLGGDGPGEIALSIMAEVVSLRAARRPGLSGGPEEAVDPVCGMKVEVTSARHVLERSGRRYYFCSAGCLRAFERKGHVAGAPA
jgi:xanthine dehydrogenase accessory factor